MPSQAIIGLEANWINGWLAALGIAVLVPDARLSWNSDPIPRAVVETPHLLADDLSEAFPSEDELDALSSARRMPASEIEFPRKVTLSQYRSRATIARITGDSGLSSTVTDLSENDGELDHSPFDPPVPQGRTLWDRLVSCCEAVTITPENLMASLAGQGTRVKLNGLGFDHRRILTPTDPNGSTWVDPAIEVLAFAGLTLIPLRGDGRRSHARGWTAPPTHPGAFSWPVWRPMLDIAAIDSLLDRYWSEQWSAPVAFESVPYRPRGSSDVTRGYASRRA